MEYSEQEIKRIAELREWLDNIIKEKERELENMRYTLIIIDNLLRSTSFKPAVILTKEEEGEVRQLKSKENVLLANAYITKDALTIVPVSDLKLTQKIPPFQSFFINRILESMKSKDMERAKSSNIPHEGVLSYKIEEDNNIIKSIMVKNYRDTSRLEEILNACEWTLARMSEKAR